MIQFNPSMDSHQILIFCLMGFLGALVKELLENLIDGDYIFVLPSIVRTKRGKGLRLGCIGSLIMGMIIAVLIDKDPATAFAMSYAGPSIFDKLFNRHGSEKNE